MGFELIFFDLLAANRNALLLKIRKREKFIRFGNPDELKILQTSQQFFGFGIYNFYLNCFHSFEFEIRVR